MIQGPSACRTRLGFDHQHTRPTHNTWPKLANKTTSKDSCLGPSTTQHCWRAARQLHHKIRDMWSFVNSFDEDTDAVRWDVRVTAQLDDNGRATEPLFEFKGGRIDGRRIRDWTSEQSIECSVAPEIRVFYRKAAQKALDSESLAGSYFAEPIRGGAVSTPISPRLGSSIASLLTPPATPLPKTCQFNLTCQLKEVPHPGRPVASTRRFSNFMKAPERNSSWKSSRRSSV